MITPRFSLSQDDNTVSIIIRAPYCSLNELDVSVDENVFLFTCMPYYLRLHLPGKLEDNDSSKSSFNSDTGEFTFQYKKFNSGEHFPDLEFVTKLLCSKIEVEDGNRKIEILGSQDEGQASEEVIENNIQYGFAMRGGYNFKILSTEFTDVFDVDPHEVSLEKRQQLRQQQEQKQFDADHYLADLLDNEEIKELIKLPVPWKTFTKANLQFTSKELDFLKDLPNVNYNLSAQQIKYCHNTLIEILYAYCYDRRTTCFDTTCESGWTISKISGSLCWFDSFLSPKQALVCAFRRSLIYPLYREFNLCQQILKDLQSLTELGEQYMIKCLIDIYDIFLSNDSGRYVLNNLFIKDYIVYIMKWDKDLWCKTVEELNCVKIEKKDLGLNLLELEAVVSDDLSITMGNLNINEESETDSDDSVTSSSSDESESSEE